MVHTHPRMMERKKIPQRDSTKECFIFTFISFYRETETTEYVYTPQVKTTAGKKIVSSLLILKNICY